MQPYQWLSNQHPEVRLALYTLQLTVEAHFLLVRSRLVILTSWAEGMRRYLCSVGSKVPNSAR